jgi:hypothetical protein
MYRLTGLLGVVVTLAPFLFNYVNHPLAFWTSLIVGAVLTISSVIEALDEDEKPWEYWVIEITGFAAVLAPFILGFGTLLQAVWTLEIIGVVAVILAGSELFIKNNPELS